MKKQGFLAALAVGLVLLAAALWLQRRTDGPDRRSEPPSALAATPDTPAELAGSELAPAELVDAGTVQGREVEEPPPAPAPREADLVWLAGSVRFPEKTPLDERVVVLAVDGPRKLRELVRSPALLDMAWDPERQRSPALVARAEVGEDGGFRIGLPPGARSAHLALTGRYLYSMATTEVSLPALEAPVLVGELGAWVTGTLLPPPDPGPLESDFEWIEVALGPDLRGGFDTALLDALGATRKTEAQSDGRFAFRGIPGHGAYGLSVEHGHLAGLLHLGVDPEPGEHLELELRMTRGATVRGRVVDDGGAAVAGAAVEARFRGRVGDAVGAVREATSAEDGSYELEHVATGRIDVVASSAGLRDGRLRLPAELQDGAELDGADVVLERGARITGVVRFPDGVPLEGGTVRAKPDLSQLGGMDAMNVVGAGEAHSTTDAAGRFELTGLGKGKFVVTAEATVEEGDHAGRWRATERGVVPGGSDLGLELEGLVGLDGRVVDMAGEPLPDFTVRATLHGSGAMFGLGAERRTQGFEAVEDGRFRLESLTPSVWELEVLADGHAASAVQEVALPRPADAPELLFTLERAAAVAGVVLDPLGTRVPGARVTLDLDLAARMHAMESAGIPEVFSDAEGRFEMKGLTPGTASLVAALDGYAASEAVPCEVLAGEVTEGVELVLRVGGTLTGIVYDDEGHRAAGQTVIAQRPPAYASQRLLTSDGRGEFRIERLEAGPWQIIATPTDLFGGARPGDESEPDMATLLGGMKMAMVEIVDGEETHVELGSPPPEPVQVRGRVTHAGQPVPGAMVTLLPQGLEGADVLSAMKMKVTDEHGAFEVQLDRGGAFLATVQTGMSAGSQNSVEFSEQVPERATTHEVELELPGGRIAGRVLGPDRKPLADCRVSVNVEDGVALGSLLGGNAVETRTDAQGRYEAPYLRAGTYTVAAGGLFLGGLLGGESHGGRAVRGGVRVDEGRSVEGVDFELEEPATLAGTVVDAGGAPVAEASVFVRDEEGRLLERLSTVASDANGRFSVSGLAPGRYLVSARSGERVGVTGGAVAVASDEVSEVQLTLLPGTLLLVQVVDQSGADVRARVRVTDAAGHEHVGMLSMKELMEGLRGSPTSDELRVGPLPEGRYTITATHEDGRQADRTLSLSGQGERKVRVRLR